MNNNGQCVFSLLANRSTSALPLTLAVPNHPNRLGVQSPLSLRIYIRNHRRVVGANQYMLLFQLVAENHLELRRLLPAPGGLCATGSEILSYSPEAGIPLAHYSPAVSRCIRRDHHARRYEHRGTPRLKRSGCVRASMWPRYANIPKSTSFTGLEIPAIAAAGACVIIPDVIPLNPPP